MTIQVLWSEGAEDYSITPNAVIDSAIANGQRWASASGVKLSVEARTGNYSLWVNELTQMRRSLRGDHSTIGIAWSAFFTALPAGANAQWYMMSFRNSYGKTIAAINLSPTGRVRILDKSGTQIAISSREVSAGRHNHFEARLDVANGLSVRVNDKFDVEYSGVLQSYDDVNALATRQTDEIFIGNTNNGLTTFNQPVYLDDIIAYTYDPADPLIGKQGVYYLKPIEDTAQADWQLSSGVNGYALVDTIAPLGDNSFIFSDTVGNKSRFKVEPLPVNVVSVLAVQPTVYARTTDSGPGNMDLGVNSAGTEEMGGDDFPLQTDYGYNDIVPVMLDPDTSSAWDPLFMPDIVAERTV